MPVTSSRRSTASRYAGSPPALLSPPDAGAWAAGIAAINCSARVSISFDLRGEAVDLAKQDGRELTVVGVEAAGEGLDDGRALDPQASFGPVRRAPSGQLAAYFTRTRPRQGRDRRNLRRPDLPVRRNSEPCTCPY